LYSLVLNQNTFQKIEKKKITIVDNPWDYTGPYFPLFKASVKDKIAQTYRRAGKQDNCNLSVFLFTYIHQMKYLKAHTLGALPLSDCLQ